MPPPDHPTDAAADDMSDYLQMFMDETEEQLEGLVDALLVLEEDANDENAINEAFRLIHSIKGSAGMMGLESIALLTHHLESRFELFRSRARILDNPTMNLVLRCIDFLRECIRRMRAGEDLGPVAPLLEELETLDATEASAPTTAPADPAAGTNEGADATPEAWATQADHAALVVVEFEPDLPLADLKAKLISARLSKLGDVLATRPALEDLAPGASLTRLELLITTEASVEEIREEADADGVARVEVGEAQGAPQATAPADPQPAESPPPTSTRTRR